MMNVTERMECLSTAYVQAVAAKAGFQVSRPPVDDDSVDGQFMGRAGRRPRLDFQLKATAQQDLIGADKIAFPLSLKNYEDLRADCVVPRILIVLAMPENEQEWLAQSEAELILRRCAYWRSLAGESATGNTTSVTVHILRDRLFTPESLTDMMRRVEAEEPLWP